MIYYIYYLIDPNDKKVRYVGCSKNPKRRFYQHLHKLDVLHTDKRKWLESLFRNRQEPIMKVVKKCIGEEEAREQEQHHLDMHIETALNIHNPEKGAASREGHYPKRKEEQHGV
jgi:hypothetical protein